MSRPAEQLFELPRLPTEDDLPADDGIPMESERHYLQMELLLQGLELWAEARGDVVYNGNQFLYFNTQHLLARDFRGPDVYVVTGVRPGERKSWVVWQEGKSPDVVIDLLSDSTAEMDKGAKKQIYQCQLRVPNDYWLDPFNPEDRAGFILQGTAYRPLERDSAGRLPVPSLGLQLGLWEGSFPGITIPWLRWMGADGKLLPLRSEQALAQARQAEQAAALAQKRADEAQQRDEAEKRRGEAAEAELIRVHAQLRHA